MKLLDMSHNIKVVDVKEAKEIREGLDTEIKKSFTKL